MPGIRQTTRELLPAFLLTLASCGSDDPGPVGTTGAIALTTTPSTLVIDQGTGNSLSVALTRTGGFSGAVTLSSSGLPTGVTATITPSELSPTATTASITVTVAAAVPAQTYNVTITATAAAVSSATATLALTVRTRASAPTDVSYQFCDASTAPVFFAYQDGTDEWQSVPASTSAGKTTFSFKLARAVGGVIAVYQNASSAVAGRTRRATSTNRIFARPLGAVRERYAVRANRMGPPPQTHLADTYITEVQYASAAELAQDAAEYCALTQPVKTVTAVVAGVAAGRYSILSLGSSTEIFDGGTATNPVTFADVSSSGGLDFVATRFSPGSVPDRVVVLRNLNIPHGGSLPATVDFTASTTTPAAAIATIQGASGDDLEIFTELVTTRSGRSLFWFDLAPSKVTQRPWTGLTAATMISGDFHSVIVFASAATEGDFRVSLKYVRQVGEQTLALGPAMTSPSTSLAASGVYPRFRFQGVLPAEYNKGLELSLSAADDGNAYSIAATGAYLAAAGEAVRYDLFMPDVRGLVGFPGASRLSAGPNELSFGAHTFTGPGVFDLTPNVGSEYRAATKAGTVVVPP